MQYNQIHDGGSPWENELGEDIKVISTLFTMFSLSFFTI